MRSLSHLGYWKSPGEKNSLAAFAHPLDLRFGLETDVRDSVGRLVISHDMLHSHEMSFGHLISLFQDKDLPLAINIKADGLAASIKRGGSSRNLRGWFASDMLIPDMRTYLDEGLSVFARVSEVEREPAWIDEGCVSEHHVKRRFDRLSGEENQTACKDRNV